MICEKIRNRNAAMEKNRETSIIIIYSPLHDHDHERGDLPPVCDHGHHARDQQCISIEI